MAAYYNEIDPYAVQWLRNLIAEGHIADGVVDDRSIEEVEPDDLKEFTQCHFFAGIGAWSYALRLAGWPDDRPVWTGSCPCQPFSVAGKAGGFADERHLWPSFHHLIKERRPAAIFGEQVASKDGLAWLDLVQTDLEGEGYAVGAADLCAAGVGAPHIRQRLYWAADADYTGLEGRDAMRQRANQCVAGPSSVAGTAGPTNGFWRDADWLGCRDGKWRPVEPGTRPLAHGAATRVGRLRAYGNAINVYQAEAFITAYLEAKWYGLPGQRPTRAGRTTRGAMPQ